MLLAMARESREVWAKRVERWRDSGLTAKEFAAETGIQPGRLAYWKWRLSPKVAERECPAALPTATSFVEVVAPAAMTPAPVSEPAEPLEIVLRDGILVRVPARFDMAALQRVVSALQGR